MGKRKKICCINGGALMSQIKLDNKKYVLLLGMHDDSVLKGLQGIYRKILILSNFINQKHCGKSIRFMKISLLFLVKLFIMIRFLVFSIEGLDGGDNEVRSESLRMLQSLLDEKWSRVLNRPADAMSNFSKPYQSSIAKK